MIKHLKDEWLNELKKDYSELELKRANYVATSFVYEITKLIMLLIIFGLLGRLPDFFICLLFVMPVRIFSGGLHFNHYISCFLFTFVFFAAPIFLLNHIRVSTTVEICSLCTLTAILFFIGPVISKKRPPIKKKAYQKFLTITICFLLVDIICFLLFPDFPCRTSAYWILILHFLQLFTARIQAWIEKREVVTDTP